MMDIPKTEKKMGVFLGEIIELSLVHLLATITWWVTADI